MYRLILLAALAICLAPATHAQDLSLRPDDPASTVHPRRFGSPGGIGQTRGWYVWERWDAPKEQAIVRHEGTGEKFTVRVLPWATTYCHLAYGAQPGDLLPGERVNCFFNPDAKQPRAYLVHFQDEMSQMKGHNHAWQIESVQANGFTARVMAGDKPLDERVGSFQFDAKCRLWRAGKVVADANVKVGERVLLTWVYDGTKRMVKVLSDAASLDAIQAEAKLRIQERVQKDGMTGFVEEVAKEKSRLLIFATWWAQANELKPGQHLQVQANDKEEAVPVRIVSRKNLGAYGSGCTELIVEGKSAKHVELTRTWTDARMVRIRQDAAADDKALDGPWVNPPTEKIPNTHHATFPSKSLGKPVGFNIYLPPQPENKKKQKLPVAYHLHGRTDSESTHLYNVRLLDRAIADGKVPPMICVYSYAGRQSWFTDWKNGPVKSETILRELIAHVDATYPTDAKRESRGFLGWSMGGFGALKLGMQTPELASAVVCFGGGFLSLDDIKKRLPNDFERVFGKDDDYFRKNSPFDLVPLRANAVQGKVAIRLAVGTKDGLLENNRRMHKLLDTHKIAHEYEEIAEVGHSPKAMYDAQMVQAFAFFAKVFRGNGTGENGATP